MNTIFEGTSTRACWFVGASYGGTEDQTPRFLSEGIWENGYENEYLDLVRSMNPGDLIAIKSSYTRKHNLPFDNRGQTVSVMAIKAVGTITENLGDGRRVRVNWTPLDPPREWYFYTHRRTIWRVVPSDWMMKALIEFAFEGKHQDIDRFRNDPYWRERFGDIPTGKQRFQWTKFYEAIADKLLAFRGDRAALLRGIYDIAGRVDGLNYLQDQYADGSSGPLKDVCPFTTIGVFNRGITDSNRKTIAAELASFLGVQAAVPESFEGIPVLHNLKSWFFSFEKNRKSDDIEALWEVFERAVRFAESDDAETRSAFENAFDNANGRLGVGWNLTFGLYWIRPWNFLSLDAKSQHYIAKKLGMDIGHHGPKNRCNATDYLDAMDALETRFEEENYPVHSFPELSLEAWLHKDTEDLPEHGEDIHEQPSDDDLIPESGVIPPPIVPYSLDDIIAEGCFIERSKLEDMLERLQAKKNLILQGPPGTGKTWLGKRLGFALIGERDESKLRPVQFHPNLSYEDFVRGWRPTGEGRLSLVDGPFMEMVNIALKEPSVRYVVVIEEINRGNPAQIFGEMLTLLEADKRTPTEALELCYRRTDEERVFVPENLYIIGTMNIADRSLALVDFALRRRFAFVNLEPALGKAWHEWVNSRFGIEMAILDEIEKRITALNNQIAADTSLGPQFRIGHSFVTPSLGVSVADGVLWFKRVVDTEIAPLLEEYWFDDLERARDARQHLVEGL
ncbi:MAG: AAA family ATPase [Candidatus Marsarchaeota archaeon]|nr:AAA family ATPase [Candidatus Marsarchaeota archaeon]